MKSKPLLLIICLVSLSFSSFISDKQTQPRLGIVTGLAQDSIAYSAGFEMIGESVRKMLSPPITDEEFLINLKHIKAAKCKVMSCNLFYPGSMKIAGPDVKESEVLTYTEVVLSRAKKAGIKYIVLGSSDSRRIPADYDLTKSKSDFVTLCKKLGQLAGKHHVIILLENLETTETNFLTSLKSAAEIVRKVDHPNFRLNVDIYHMMKEGESPQEIIAASDLVAFSEIAEKEKRSLPGVMRDDFRPYLRALKAINYKGFIFLEGNITNAAVEIPLSFKYLSNQIAEVYSEKN
jgi:sugar phosphate isomerase/epimerase